MFPINSDLGSASIDLGRGDPMDQAIEAGKNLALFNRDYLQPTGLQQVANTGIRPQQSQQPMNVQVSYPDEGAKLLRKAEADAIYNSYKQPALQAGQVLANAGIKPNDQNLPGNRDNIDLELNRDLKRSQIDRNVRDNSKLKVITITDPNDPTKQINVNYDQDTGTVSPITLPNNGGKVQPGAQAKANQVEADKTKKEAESTDILKQHAQDALNELNNISKATGKFDTEGNSVEELSPELKSITGFSGNIPAFIMNLNPNLATARAAVERLKNMLTLDRMQSLRAQSKTGSTGFGNNMNQKEFSTLISSASKLVTMNQSEPGFAKELGRIRVLLSKVANGPDAITKNEGMIEKEIPNSGGRIAISSDGGKTWKAK